MYTSDINTPKVREGSLDQEYLKELISDHASNPRKKYRIEQSTCSCHGKNPLCGDEVTIYVRLSPSTSIIEEVAFEGRGCPISLASASMVTEFCEGLSKDQAKALSNYLRNEITGTSQDPIAETLAEAWTEVQNLATIQMNPARVKCVTLAWHTLNHALDGQTETDISSN
jgi:nitrogen fixation NifU-like protein